MIFIEKVIFLVPVVSCEHRHQLYPAHRRGRGAKGGLGLKNHLHFGNGWLCRGPGQRLEVPKAGSRKWWRGFPYSLHCHVANYGKDFFYPAILCLLAVHTQWPSISYVVSKLAIFDPLPPLLSFLLCKVYVVNHLWGYLPPPSTETT